MALQPVLLIGVGGSGAKSLRTLRQTLMRRLRQHGWKHAELPAAWQFVAFDTVTEQSRDGYAAPLLPASCYAGLVDPQTEYDQVRDILVSRVPGATKTHAYSGWLPREIPFPIVFGAGQNRGVGRAVSAWKLQAIHQRLSEAHSASRAPKAIEALREAATILDADGVSATPMAVVISSIAGGTGSGMFLDVVEGLKAVDLTLGNRAQVVLFGPDIFGPVIKSGFGENIAPNTMAALSEITAGSWGATTSMGTKSLYSMSGMSSVVASAGTGNPMVGSRYNYIIGAVNQAGVKVGETDDAYRAVGDSVASLVSDEDVLTGFNNFFRTNVFDQSWMSTICDDKSGLKTVDDPKFTKPFASFGSGRITLGLDRFVEYASQSISRSAVERLLWPRFHEDPDDDRTDVERVADRAALRWEEFLLATGLDERGDQDQVLDRILPEDHEGAVTTFAAAIVQRASGGVGADGQAPGDWLTRIRADLPLRMEQFKRERKLAIEQEAARYASVFEQEILGVVGRFAASEGLWVASEMVRRLVEEVRFVANEDLPTEANDLERRLDELDGRLSTALNKGLTTIPTNHPVIGEVRNVLRAAVERLLEPAIRRRVAAELMAVMREEVIEPLAYAIRTGRDSLSLSATSDTLANNLPNPFLDYPRLGDQPGSRFEPGPTEFLLVETGRYREDLEDNLRRTYPAELADQWQQRTIERTILHLPLARAEADEVPALFKVRAGWMPTTPAFRWRADASPQVGSYALPSEVEDYRETAEDLLSDPDSAMGRYLSQTLEGFLRVTDVTERVRRWDAFTNGLISAFDASAPLANVNTKLLSSLHPGTEQRPSLKVLSPIPVDKSGDLADLYSQIKNALETRDYWTKTVEDAFKRTNASQVDIFQALGVGVSAMAFTSLMRPIAESWSKVRFDENKANGFRSYKRARPLTETIPVSYDRISHMVKGWVVAGLLGLRRDGHMDATMTRVSSGTKIGGSAFRFVEIWDLDADRWLSFPFPLYERRAQGMQILPAVLDSVQLAMAQCNAESSVEPLAPYRALIAIGEFLDGESSPLSAWLLHGQTASGAPTPNPAEAGSPDSDVDGRREKILTQLRRTKEQYERHFTAHENANDPFKHDLAWEVKDWILAAYEEVIDVVMSIEDATGFNF
jgi:hypothetical protein